MPTSGIVKKEKYRSLHFVHILSVIDFGFNLQGQIFDNSINHEFIFVRYIADKEKYVYQNW